MIYFSLAPTIYGAYFGDSVIILDRINNKYISLIGAASHYLSFILSHGFVLEDKNYCCISLREEDSYDSEQLNFFINHFLDKKFIVISMSQNHKKLAPPPLKPGGLVEYQWTSKISSKLFSQASLYEVLKAFFQLARTHYAMKHGGINKILSSIKKAKLTDIKTPHAHEIAKLAAAVDAAALLYPKKTFCLAWSATFVVLALKKKWPCNLVIGIQTNPFYAHAWAEISDNVINDDPVIAQVLSIILKEPY